MRRLILFVAAILAAGPARSAVEMRELAVFVDGRLLEISAATLVDDDSVRLDLPGGGSIEVPLTRLERVIEDAVEVPDEPVPPAPACTASFAEQELPAALAWRNEIMVAARAADLHPWLVAAVVEAESRFDPRAVSHAGARGLMQLMPAVWLDAGIHDPHDPRANLAVGCRHLRRLIDRFGDLSLALAAYNAGPATVERYGGVPPFRETRGYLRRVLGSFCAAPPLDVTAGSVLQGAR